ncbi:GIY-YIG nuclease family protein [Streptomyces sp. NBC_01716]|uniref:GIY-YIG nuclease family protein n=1 Tax=Streptomyces sp. NBC_01716 TaxID=2975917 RepID=UPI002E324150|nr:GIY-YIG nuclease family protein [Streptomyces sp. NBC_01716]
MPKNPGRTALYRLFDESGALLYVGISHKPDVRWGQHSEQKAWWPAVAQRAVEWHETRSGAEKAELAAIATERPLHNKMGTPAYKISTSAGKSPTRPIRVDLAEWGVFGEAANAVSSDRSAALRGFMDWYLHKPGSKAPTRPSKAVVEAAQKAYLKKQAEKANNEEGRA